MLQDIYKITGGQTMNENTQLLDLNYQQCYDFLIEKYSSVPDDYFSEKSYNRFKKGEIKSLSKKSNISRTNDGLYIHHIDEDKQILIANPKIIIDFDIPFSYQKKDRLVYCNLIEHAILHILIAKEDKGKSSFGHDNQYYGIDGYVNFIRPELVSWLIHRNIPKLTWQKNCRDVILMSKEEAVKLINKLDDFLVENYPISKQHIDGATGEWFSKFGV